VVVGFPTPPRRNRHSNCPARFVSANQRWNRIHSESPSSLVGGPFLCSASPPRHATDYAFSSPLFPCSYDGTLRSPRTRTRRWTVGLQSISPVLVNRNVPPPQRLCRRLLRILVSHLPGMGANQFKGRNGGSKSPQPA